MLKEEELDIAVSRVLKVKFMMGLFENPYANEEIALKTVGASESKAVALEIAREVLVLLENKDNLLPLGQGMSQIAVIGPNSNSIYNQLGDYTQWQEDGKVITVLEGIKKHAPHNTKIVSAHGCSIRGKDMCEFEEAIKIAKDSDVIVLVLGGSSTREPGMTFEDNGAVFMDQFTSDLDCGEAVDLADVELGGVQITLAKELKKLGKPLITVLIQGRPYAVPWLKENSEALLCGWYPGEKGGDAIGEIIFGKTVPSGKLSISVPRSSAQLPVYYNRKNVRGYVDMSETPLYAFGYGCSYTTFKYDEFCINHKSLTYREIIDGKRFAINFKITNRGVYDGKEVAQLYIHDIESCITRREKELKDFTKVQVNKNESVNVSLSVGLEELSIYNYNMDFVLEHGRVKLMIGDSSDNIIYEIVVVIEE